MSNLGSQCFNLTPTVLDKVVLIMENKTKLISVTIAVSSAGVNVASGIPTRSNSGFGELDGFQSANNTCCWRHKTTRSVGN